MAGARRPWLPLSTPPSGPITPNTRRPAGGSPARPAWRCWGSDHNPLRRTWRRCSRCSPTCRCSRGPGWAGRRWCPCFDTPRSGGSTRSTSSGSIASGWPGRPRAAPRVRNCVRRSGRWSRCPRPSRTCWERSRKWAARWASAGAARWSSRRTPRSWPRSASTRSSRVTWNRAPRPATCCSRAARTPTTSSGGARTWASPCTRCELRSGQVMVPGPFREAATGPQARPQPDDLVLPRQAGESPQRQRGVDHRQLRHGVAPFELHGAALGAAEGLVQQAAGEHLGIVPSEVATRDRAGPRRPVEGEDELLTVAVLEVAVVQPGVVGVAQARRGATSLVVRVVRGEDKPGFAGVLVLGLHHRGPPCSGDRGVPRCVTPGPAAPNRRAFHSLRPRPDGTPYSGDRPGNGRQADGRVAAFGRGVVRNTLTSFY